MGEMRLLTAKVFHKRLFPKVNGFHYGVYYVALPLPFTGQIPYPLMSFKAKNYGARDGSCLYTWAKNLLQTYQIDAPNITLITMPRLFGYGFNPVSFYLCRLQNELKAVIAEVHNTFGEAHSYLCFKKDKSEITKNDEIIAEKLFHVSPFLERNGHYSFRFDAHSQNFKAIITYFDENNQKQLLTSLGGEFTDATSKNLSQAFWKHPLVTLKVISLIHFQALKLFVKGIKIITKPLQYSKTLTPPKDQNHV